MATRHLFSRSHILLFALSIIVLLVGLFASPEHSKALFVESGTVTTEPAEKRATPATATPPADPAPVLAEPDPVQRYQIQAGDTLSAIFESRGISLGTLHELLAADAEYLSLEILHPGTELAFRFNDQQHLEQLTLHVDPARKVVFQRQDNGSFSYQHVEAETRWSYHVRSGAIEQSFFKAGLRAGLTEQQVEELARMLKRKIDFRREIRKGDPFTVLVANEVTHEQETGRYRIEAVSLSTRGRTTNAFLYTDGNYYDENGESILPAFRRWPTQHRFRISSPFDPGRIHPMTGRISPHNGVDLATPIGTRVMSTGDGVVTRIGDHPYAGKYINIRHNGSLTTRYLHLSRVLVHKGQRVKRGQKIALSGNTGRSTGPHLHFEFRIDGRPVNPVTADIPTATKVPSDAFASFTELAQRRLALMRTVEMLAPARAHAQVTQTHATGSS
ncbi:peptidoglycan DD-metalloendopeptidase family protein [Marinobacter oulmenensis]|uniref:Murein DD-endopeptidase n=1 Tax=Marinobacter oulmenensis TaxID=643747 RepID=A0A840U7P5_9GAMM|nr:peptidoglycan DD-metalloendopeptidase family protein [Marinobacter oulmenensis]MBB5320972.1 murein DD-endopeptidase [Marinobacter oulmenensis]